MYLKTVLSVLTESRNISYFSHGTLIIPQTFPAVSFFQKTSTQFVFVTWHTNDFGNNIGFFSFLSSIVSYRTFNCIAQLKCKQFYLLNNLQNTNDLENNICFFSFLSSIVSDRTLNLIAQLKCKQFYLQNNLQQQRLKNKRTYHILVDIIINKKLIPRFCLPKEEKPFLKASSYWTTSGINLTKKKQSTNKQCKHDWFQ